VDSVPNSDRGDQGWASSDAASATSAIDRSVEKSAISYDMHKIDSVDVSGIWITIPSGPPGDPLAAVVPEKLLTSGGPHEVTFRTFACTGASAELRALLVRAGLPLRFARRSLLFAQGEEPLDVLILTAGLVKLSRLGPNGGAAIIGLRGPAWLLGSEALLTGEPYAVSACAVLPCEAHRLSGTTFVRLLREDPTISAWVHRLQAEEVASTLARAGDRGILSARQRLATLLEDLEAALPLDRRGRELPLRDWEIAQLVGVTPPYLSRLVHELTSADRLRRLGTSLYIPPDTAPDH